MSSLSVVCLGVLDVALVIVTLVYVDDEPVSSRVLEKNVVDRGSYMRTPLVWMPRYLRTSRFQIVIVKSRQK